MRVLITNDDGIAAEGIHVLAAAAREVFEEVVVVAPDSEQSGIAQAISLHRPLRLTEHGEGRYAVSGTPVDAVYVALGHLLKETPPDLVLSGLNHGPNLGLDVYYSGTVGAAREALIHGFPSVALSVSGRDPFPFEALAPAVREVLRRVRAHGVPERALLNVNFPAPDPARWPAATWGGVPGLRGLRVTDLGRRYYGNEVILREDPRGRPYFWIGGGPPRLDERPGTDCDVVHDGFVSLTPLGLDATRHDLMAPLSPYRDALDGELP